MKITFALLLSLSTLAGAQTEPTLDLAPLIANEEAAVQAVRDFHIEQMELVKQELKIAGPYYPGRDPEVIATIERAAFKRVDSIKGAYLEVLRHYPRNAKACNYLGELLYDALGQRREAVELWTVAMSYDDKLSAPMNNLAIHYGHTGAPTRSLRLFGQALKLEPKNPDYLFNLVQFYMNNFHILEKRFDMPRPKLYKIIMRMSKRARKYAPDDYALSKDYALNFFAAENFDAKADWRKAAKAWEYVRPLASTKTETFATWLNEGRAWLRRDDLRKARRCFEEASALMPESDITKQLLAKTKKSSE